MLSQMKREVVFLETVVMNLDLKEWVEFNKQTPKVSLRKMS